MFDKTSSVRKFNFIVIGALALLLLCLVACGDSKKGGKVIFELSNSDTPTTPHIAVPDSVTKFRCEVFQLPEQVDTSGEEAADSEPTASASRQASKGELAERAGSNTRPLPESTNAAGSSSDNGSSDEVSPSNSDSDEAAGDSGDSDDSSDNNSQDDEASYGPFSVTKDYSGGDFSVEVDNVAAGAWTLRVSALTASDEIVGYVQKAVTISKGKKVTVREALLAGSAPEGYLYISGTSAGTLSCLSLASGKVTSMTFSEHPAYLFTKSLTPVVGDTIYGTTGSDKVLRMAPKANNTKCDVTEVYFPTGGTFVAAGSKAVVSMFSENGVRFFDYDTEKSSDLLYTGNGADVVSNVAQDKTLVYNQGDQSVSVVDIANKTIARPNINLENPVEALALNDEGGRLWAVGGSGSGFVRVVNVNDGKLVKHYTTQIATPTAVAIVNGQVCVADSGRQELIFFPEKETVDETKRMDFNKGAVEFIVSDGQRLYMLVPASGTVSVVDLTTYSVVEDYNVGSSPRSAVLLSPNSAK